MRVIESLLELGVLRLYLETRLTGVISCVANIIDWATVLCYPIPGQDRCAYRTAQIDLLACWNIALWYVGLVSVWWELYTGPQEAVIVAILPILLALSQHCLVGALRNILIGLLEF